ncbi:ROK family protein [Streptomyces sp. NBC_00842]|nr:ROK family protein [Streptomyces sp. NBC_00842]
MCDACLTALPDALFGRAPIVADLGVAVPGLVGEARRVVSRAPHLEWGNVHVVDGLREELGNRVGVITAGNDANRAALAEYRVGSQAGSRDLVYISGRRRYRRGPDRSGKAVGRFAWIRR